MTEMVSILEEGAQGVDTSTKKPDKLVMVDAYWKKKHMGKSIKIRILPHQKMVDLYVEFVYEYDDDDHDKSATSFVIKFDIPGSCYDGNTKMSILGLDLKKKNQKYNGPLENYKDKEVYYYKISNFTSDLYYLHHRNNIDEIVLKDAYWIKEHEGKRIKIRILPHQKKVTLMVVLGFKYNKPSFNKAKAKFNLSFSVPDTHYQQIDDIVIEGSTLLNLPKDHQFKDKDGNTCYLYPIEDFTSDITDAKPKFNN